MKPSWCWRSTDPAAVPAEPGIYAIFDRGRLCYIGSAVNLRKRLSDQGMGRRWNKPLRRFSDAKHLELRTAGSRRKGDWLSREMRLISRLGPVLNRIHRGGFP